MSTQPTTTPTTKEQTMLFDRERAIATEFDAPLDFDNVQGWTTKHRYLAHLIEQIRSAESQVAQYAKMVRDNADRVLAEPTRGMNSNGVIQSSGTILDCRIAALCTLRENLATAVNMFIKLDAETADKATAAK